MGRLELSAPVRIAAPLAPAAFVAAALTFGIALEGPAAAGGTSRSPHAAERPAGAGFALGASRVKPARAFFDGPERIRLTYEFRARRALDVLVKVVRLSDGEVVRRWRERDLAPGRRQVRRWDGLDAGGDVAKDGRYAFRVGPLGKRGARAGALVLRDHAFPVAGPHSYGDRFGEPRSGGRVHEGQDLPAACGTPLVAARGGKVEARGYSAALYGYWVLIDGRATKADHFYSHLEAPAAVATGDRVRTGRRIGAVGKTGNARSEFCQLHFEIWPSGYRDGAPLDPLAELRRWDSYS